jgi:SOS-response transcriptional repressor LexA
VVTYRQAEVLKLVRDGVARGRPPTVRELAKALGVSVNAVSTHFKFLERKGLIRYEKRLANRNVRVRRPEEAGPVRVDPSRATPATGPGVFDKGVAFSLTELT